MIVDLDWPDLSDDELGWLIGLATSRRYKREATLQRMRPKPGQTLEAFADARRQVEEATEWAKNVEDHLIVLLGDREHGALKHYQYVRYLELKERR